MMGSVYGRSAAKRALDALDPAGIGFASRSRKENHNLSRRAAAVVGLGMAALAAGYAAGDDDRTAPAQERGGNASPGSAERRAGVKSSRHEGPDVDAINEQIDGSLLDERTDRVDLSRDHSMKAMFGSYRVQNHLLGIELSPAETTCHARYNPTAISLRTNLDQDQADTFGRHVATAMCLVHAFGNDAANRDVKPSERVAAVAYGLARQSGEHAQGVLSSVFLSPESARNFATAVKDNMHPLGRIGGNSFGPDAQRFQEIAYGVQQHVPTDRGDGPSPNYAAIVGAAETVAREYGSNQERTAETGSVAQSREPERFGAASGSGNEILASARLATGLDGTSHDGRGGNRSEGDEDARSAQSPSASRTAGNEDGAFPSRGAPAKPTEKPALAGVVADSPSRGVPRPDTKPTRNAGGRGKPGRSGRGKDID